MITIYFVTSNPGKVESIKNILKEINLGLDVQMLKAEYPEDKDEGTTAHVALMGAKYCAEKYQKPVLVTDAGIFIKALKGFPGVNTKFAHVRIGNEGILKLMEGKEDREVEWILSLGYCEPGKDPVEFTSSLKGHISNQEKGDQGFGFDPILIPEGYTETFAEKPALRDEIGPFKESLLKFAKWYKN